MTIDQLNVEYLLERLNKLNPNTKPEWGTLTPQAMVEHLAKTTALSINNPDFKLLIPEDKIQGMQGFLLTDKPMKRNVEVPFAPKKPTLKWSELELAIDEFIENFIAFEEAYAEEPTKKVLHPFYGELDKKLWEHLHAKHFEHHFTQFGI